MKRRNTFLRLRPHHLLCLQNFRGSGYSADFVEKMEETVSLLDADPGYPVLIVQGCDDLCAVCPHNDAGSCTSLKASVFDDRVLEILSGGTGAVPERAVSWSALRERLPAMSPDLLDTCCRDCRWTTLCKNIVTYHPE